MDFIPSFTIFFIVSSFECSQLPGISRARQPIWRSSPGGCFGSIFAAKASSKHSSCGGDAWRRPAGGLALSNIGKIGIYGRLLFAKLVNINQNSLGFIGRYLCIIYTYIYYIYWYNKYGMIIVWDGMSINSWCGLYIYFLSGGTTLQDLSRIVVLRLKWEGFLQKSSRSVILQSIFWCSADGDLGESCVGRQANHSQWHCSCTNGSHLSCQGHVTIWALPQSPCHFPPWAPAQKLSFEGRLHVHLRPDQGPI